MFISIFCHCNCSVCGTPFRKQQQQKKGRFVLHWWAVWQTVSSWWSPIAQKLSSIFRRIWRCASHTENGHVDETKKTKWTLKNETKRRSVEPIGPNDQRRSTPYYTRHTLHTLQASLHVIRIDYAHNSVLGARRVNDNGQQQRREREREQKIMWHWKASCMRIIVSMFRNVLSWATARLVRCVPARCTFVNTPFECGQQLCAAAWAILLWM